MDQDNKKYVARCRKQLYDLVLLNTNFGEIVEIYSDWYASVSYDKIRKKCIEYGPPKFGLPSEKRVIDLDAILTSELLDTSEKLKIEIRNNILS